MAVKRDAELGDIRREPAERGVANERLGGVWFFCNSSASALKELSSEPSEGEDGSWGKGGTGGIGEPGIGEFPCMSIEPRVSRFELGPLHVIRLFSRGLEFDLRRFVGEFNCCCARD